MNEQKQYTRVIHMPLEFAHRIKDTWGVYGAAWLCKIPDTIELCKKKWDLCDVQEPLSNLSQSYIAFAKTKEGKDVVLKLSVPGSVFESEIKTLKAYKTKSSISLLQYDLKMSAMLLPRIVPGTRLSELSDDKQATHIAANIMQDLTTPAPQEIEFETLQYCGEAFYEVKQLPTQYVAKMIPVQMLQQAEDLFKQLLESTTKHILLHGDLHHDNILLDQQQGWLAIDPKGVIGDPACQAARFLRNPLPALLEQNNPLTTTKTRLEILADRLQQEPDRLLKWAFVDSVLGACWNIQHTQSVKNFMSCAKIFYRLLEQKL